MGCHHTLESYKMKTFLRTRGQDSWELVEQSLQWPAKLRVGKSYFKFIFMQGSVKLIYNESFYSKNHAQKFVQHCNRDQSTDIHKRFPNGASENAQNIPSTTRRCIKIYSKEKHATCNGRYQSGSCSKWNNMQRWRNFPDKVLILTK